MITHPRLPVEELNDYHEFVRADPELPAGKTFLQCYLENRTCKGQTKVSDYDKRI